MSYNKNTDWDNERKYLENLIRTGNAGEKSWAQNQLVAIAHSGVGGGASQPQNTTTTPTTTTTNSPYNENTNWDNEKSYLTNLANNGSAGEQAWANNQLTILNDAMTQYGVTSTPTTGNTYTPTGTHNDSSLPAEALVEIQAYQKAYADAIAKGDTAAAEQAHAGAEAVRAKYGYSGGADGSEYVDLTKPNTGLSANDILSWNDNYNANNEQPTYTSKYDPEIEALLKEILTREDFSYNVENDPLYAQYKTMYNREGDRAMRDTLAEAASNAGGMNSYAIMAAQQANNYYNSQLNDKIPELYQLAYEMYLQDKESKVQDLGILTQMDDTQYNRYRDTMSDWRADKDFAYGSYLDSITQGNTEYGNAVSEKDKAKEDVWKLISVGVTPSADLIAKSGMSQIDIDLAVAAIKAGSTGSNSNTGGGSNNNGYTGGNSGGNSGGNNTGDDSTGDNIEFTGNNGNTGVTDEIKKKAASFTNNDDLANYLDGLVASGSLTAEQSDTLYAQYVDENEKYNDNGDGTYSASYSEMIKSTKGWSVVNDGGINWFWGIDRNAIVEAPDGERIRLSNLINKLVGEGMSRSDAKAAIKTLQKNLGI